MFVSGDNLICILCVSFEIQFVAKCAVELGRMFCCEFSFGGMCFENKKKISNFLIESVTVVNVLSGHFTAKYLEPSIKKLINS